jgi:chromosome segregation ATPase
LSKCESQLAEYSSRNAALAKLLEEKSSAAVADHAEVIAELSKAEADRRTGSTGQEALHSTINSLRKIVERKEETISRYQDLLKEDRDKQSEAAARLHEEIKCLRKQMTIADAARAHDNATYDKSLAYLPRLSRNIRNPLALAFSSPAKLAGA